MRQSLIDLVSVSKLSVRAAAKQLGMTYNNAKVIYRTYCREGRVKATPKHLKRMYGAFKKNPGETLEKYDDRKTQEFLEFLKPYDESAISSSIEMAKNPEMRFFSPMPDQKTCSAGNVTILSALADSQMLPVTMAAPRMQTMGS